MKPNFIDWLLTRTNENSAVGDLARDMAKDTNLPNKNSGYPRLYKHLTRCNACNGALNALSTAWDQYKAEHA
ncbi:YozE family protein [Halodesulfovibrio spirochaetisodalis]|uniref:YozE SAM-like domain-containing protein n=1 Tax=Halodesulfovibrio spirochaetisodalis TaxID=1560234 RepID=A0A1B7XQ45_9BACT|nr:hypothetical protein SP90_00955 [Halodesulfovibrio spirochaetisodalis]